MSKTNRAKIVLKILNKIYPKTPIPLKHKNTFTFEKWKSYRRELLVKFVRFVEASTERLIP